MAEEYEKYLKRSGLSFKKGLLNILPYFHETPLAVMLRLALSYRCSCQMIHDNFLLNIANHTAGSLFITSTQLRCRFKSKVHVHSPTTASSHAHRTPTNQPSKESKGRNETVPANHTCQMKSHFLHLSGVSVKSSDFTLLHIPRPRWDKKLSLASGDYLTHEAWNCSKKYIGHLLLWTAMRIANNQPSRTFANDVVDLDSSQRLQNTPTYGLHVEMKGMCKERQDDIIVLVIYVSSCFKRC